MIISSSYSNMLYIILIDAELLGILPCNRFLLLDMTGKVLLIMQAILPQKSVAT